MWSLGVMTFALFDGKLPFDEKDETIRDQKVLE
jgi:hypothetical protein